MIKQNQEFLKQQKGIGNLLKNMPFSANQVTILSLFIAIVAAILVINNYFLAGALVFLVAGFMDIVDGAVARAKNQVTSFGGFIDGVIDRFVEAILLFSLMFCNLPVVFGVSHMVWLGLLIFTGTCMPSFVRAYGEHKQVVDHKTAINLGGVFERTERTLAIGLGLIIGVVLGWQWFIYVLIVSIVLSMITIVQRIIWIHEAGTNKPQEIVSK